MTTEFRINNSKCNTMGKAFKCIAKEGYDCVDAVRQIMTSDKLDVLFSYDDCFEWVDGEQLLHNFKRHLTFKKGDPIDSYVMWFIGYLYKYWMIHEGDSRAEIYKIAPIEVLLRGFAFYHTQGWSYIISDLKIAYNEKNSNNSQSDSDIRKNIRDALDT